MGIKLFLKLFFLTVLTTAVFNKSWGKTSVFSLQSLKKNSLKPYLNKAKSLSKSQIRYLEEGKTISNSESEVLESKQQDLDFYISKIHPNRCKYALKKLSTYEKYKEYMGFIDKSHYIKKSGEVYFYIKSSLLPYSMHLKFKIPRISKPGLYPFTFDNGIFKGLKGNILALDYNKKCLIYTQAYWKGNHTKIPSLVIEIFSETLSKLSINKVFRATTI